jgi:DNA-binding MarR family transcriptional regulator
VHALAAALADLDLTASEINTLANLADGRARNVRELSTDTGTRATTLTGVLDRLERRGYLTRELDPADRRSFRLTLTASGRPVAARVHTVVTDLEHDALAGLSTRQIAGYHAVITALQEVS